MMAMGVMIWPAVAGGLSAVAVYVVSSVLIEQRRVRIRREKLRGRLFK